MSPHTSRTIGNLVMTSNANVNVNETTVDGVPCYMMENQHLKACIKKVGNSTNYTSIDTQNLVVQMYNKDQGKELGANFSVFLNRNLTTSTGKGFTKATRKQMDR